MNKPHTDVVLPPTDDISGDGFARCHPLSFHGRIGRLRYLAWFSSLLLVFLPWLHIGLSLIFAFNGQLVMWLLPADLDSVDAVMLSANLYAPVFIALLILVLLPSALLLLCFSSQRLHDLGFSGWFYLLLLLPYIGLLLLLPLLCLPGTQGRNRYGLPPTVNTPLVIMLAILWPFALLMLLALVGNWIRQLMGT